jgi:ketosteroid isomerase-like protein
MTAAEQQIITDLYAALDRRDGDAMAAAYRPDATFRDPAFGELHGPEVGAMWRMLCASATDLEVEARDVQVTGDTGRADWTATYTFSATGRPVVNRVHAEFRFVQGLIAEHRDTFSMWAWSRQALGPAAVLLGSNPIGRAVLQRKARGRLEEAMGKAR